MLLAMVNDTAPRSGRFHAAKFYETPESLCQIVADFLSQGLIVQEPALAIATPEHRAGILAELRARGLDVDGLTASGDLLLLDAADELASFMVDGMPDQARFTAAMSRALEQVCRGRHCTTRAYGEMVDLLWKAGHDAAAIRVELFWNTLATTHAFSILCGYSMGNFYKDAGLGAIRHEHSHVVSPGETLPSVNRTTATATS